MPNRKVSQGWQMHRLSLLQYKNQMINEGEKIFNDMTTAKNAMATLGKIALKPQIFGDTDYFEQMIQQEEKNLEEGWRGRRDEFKKMQDLVIARKKLSEANSISDLFPQYKSMVDEASNLDSMCHYVKKILCVNILHLF